MSGHGIIASIFGGIFSLLTGALNIIMFGALLAIGFQLGKYLLARFAPKIYSV